MSRTSLKILIAGLALTLLSLPAFGQATLFQQATPGEGGPMGGPYVPPGNLYDNEQSDATTSLASQDSSGTFFARTADDFTIDGTGCDSGVFDISMVRVQITQQPAAPQAFGIDFFDDNGMGTAPVSGAGNEIASFSETSQANLGPFGVLNIFQADFDVSGDDFQLNGDTTYWISAFGVDAAANAAGFNNFFAASAGLGGTTANGVLIAPDAGVADWTPVELVIGDPPLAFSFAIDGECMSTTPPLGSNPFDPNIPTLSPVGIGLMAGVLALLAVFVIARRRG